MSSEQGYLIWSNEHRAWWKPDHRGYTTATLNAGVYPKDEADRICAKANYRPGVCNEVAVLAPPEWETHGLRGKGADVEAFAHLRAAALDLEAQDQLALATIIAQNVGYDLVPEGDHPDSPHAREAEAKSGGEA